MMYTVWYYDLATWRALYHVSGVMEADAVVRHLAGRELYLRVAPYGAGPDQYIQAEA